MENKENIISVGNFLFLTISTSLFLSEHGPKFNEYYKILYLIMIVTTIFIIGIYFGPKLGITKKVNAYITRVIWCIVSLMFLISAIVTYNKEYHYECTKGYISGKQGIDAEDVCLEEVIVEGGDIWLGNQKIILFVICLFVSLYLPTIIKENDDIDDKRLS